ncbi:hypothetical protein BC937DRAFT_87770 [Endogone sp. FLAS-F59071]|nr:hypothetical protein BC937DRAFT_87770 [Endogone sp. FLAS-F59071]|eukprot:RUS19252.1 hypothetical protein BC937DRAFT_87770 [Endogone sp. FLAS-F59071]
MYVPALQRRSPSCQPILTFTVACHCIVGNCHCWWYFAQYLPRAPAKKRNSMRRAQAKVFMTSSMISTGRPLYGSYKFDVIIIPSFNGCQMGRKTQKREIRSENDDMIAREVWREADIQG